MDGIHTSYMLENGNFLLLFRPTLEATFTLKFGLEIRESVARPSEKTLKSGEIYDNFIRGGVRCKSLNCSRYSLRRCMPMKKSMPVPSWMTRVLELANQLNRGFLKIGSYTIV